MSDVPSPKASRQSRPKWLDPKLFLGVLLVLGSMAGGAQIIGEADRTTTVYVASDDIARDAPVTEDDLENIEVRFPSQDDSNYYIGAGDDIPDNARSSRTISAGEMIPRDALTNRADPNIMDFAVPVSNSRMPKGLKNNDLVDVVLQPQENQSDTTETPSAETVLENAVVISAPDDGSGSAVSGDTSVTLRVNQDEAEGFDRNAFFGALSQRDVVLTRSPVQSD